MSLRFWLPLTKDLKNQGLSSIIPAQTSGFTKITTGKLGECYKFTGVFDTLLPLSEWDWTTQSVSFGCWAKISKTELSTLAEVPSYSSTYTTMGGTLLGRDSYGGIAIRWQTNNIYTDSVLNKLYVYTHIRNTNSQTNQTSSQEVPFDTWFHIMTVIDRNDSQIKLYLNGELVKSIALTVTGTFATGTFRIAEATWHGGNGNSSSGCWQLNDVRVYDHALSPLEVKEISKGLILHYPLNRGGWGQENLVNNSDFSNLATTGTVIRDETVLFHGHPTCKISRTGATSNTYAGWTSQDLFSRLTPGTKVTASVWVYRENTHGIDSGCEWRMYQRYNNGASTDWTGFYSASNWSIGKWERFTHTYTVRSDVSSAYLNFNVVKNGTYWLAEPKVEIGEKATSWSPSVTDTFATTMGLNSTIEYDCSGYCNNGTRTGTFSWTSDTPRYQISTYFADGSTSYITASVFMPTDKITTSVWFKGDGSTSGANSYHIPFCLGSGTAEFSVDNAKLYRQGYYINGTRYCDTISGAIVNDGQWHMMTATYDGTILCRYLDGQLINSKSISGTLNGGMLTLLIGKYYQGGYNNKKVKQSDVRVYATALSAEDVKDLYELGATIDTNGTLSTYEFAEQ